MIKDLFKDLSKYLPSYIIPGLVGIISLPIITRLISPEEYGNYVLILAAVYILSALATAWLSSSSVRFYPVYKRDNQLEEFYSVIIKLIFTAVISIVLMSLIILFFIRNIIPTNLYSLMYIGLLLFLINSSFEVFLNILRAKRQAGRYSFFKIWRNVIGLLLGIILIMIFHWGARSLLGGLFLSMALALPFLYRFAIGKVSFKKGNVFSPMALEIIKYGLPVTVLTFANWIIMFSDRYVINLFLGKEAVGIYSIGYTVPQQSIFLIVTLIMLAASPIAFNLWERQGVKASQVFLTKLSRYYLLIALPVTVGLSILSKPLMRVLTTSSYFSAYQVIPLVAFSFFLDGIGEKFSMVIIYYKKTKVNMFCNLFCAALNLGLNFLLIPKYGYMAAALTTFIAFTVNMLMKIVISRQFLVWQFPFNSLGKIASASAVMGAVVYYLDAIIIGPNLINLIVVVCAGIGVYFGMLVLLHEFRLEEIKELRIMAHRVFNIRN